MKSLNTESIRFGHPMFDPNEMDTFADLLPQPVFETDRSGRLRYANRAAMNCFDFPVEQLNNGLSVLEVISETDRDRASQVFQKLVDGKISRIDSEFTVRNFRGVTFPIVAILSSVIVNNETIGVRGVLIEFSKTGHSNQLYTQSDDRYRSLYANLAIGTIYHTEKGLIDAANPAAAAILGTTVNELIGRSSFDSRTSIYSEVGATIGSDEFPSTVALTTGKLTERICGVRLPSSTHTRWYKVTAIPQLRFSEERAYQVVTSFEDITARKKLSEAVAAILGKESDPSGIEYLRFLAQELAIILETKYAFIGELTTTVPGRFSTVGIWSDDRFAEDEEFSLKNTIVETAIKKKLFYQNKINAQDFPKDKFLKQFNATDFCSQILTGHNHIPIGLIAVLNDRPIAEIEIAKSIMALFALRISSEIERRRIDEELQNANYKFKTLLSEMTEGVAFHEVIYDSSGKPINYRVIEVNTAFLNILGFQRDKVIGKLATEIFGVDYPPYLKEYSATAVSRVPYRFEIYFEPLRKHFDINVVSIQKGFFTTIFTDITDRKATESELQKNTEYYTFLTDSINDIVAQVDRDLVYTFLSRSLLMILGFDNKSLIGQSFTANIHPEDRPRIESTIRTCALAKATRLTLEYRHFTVDGDLKWIESTTRVLYDSNNEFDGCVLSSRDITDRKRAQQALKMSESQFRALAEGAKDAIFIKDSNLRYVFVNPVMASLLGLAVENMIGKTDHELLGERSNSYEIADQEVLLGKTVETEPTERIHGVWKTMHTIKVPLRTSQGEIIGICGIARDVTERNQSELALRESEERYRLLVDSLPVGIVAHCEGKIVFVNQTVVKMIGVESVLDLLGKSAIEFVHPEDRQRVATRMRAVIENREMQPSIEERFVRSDGSLFEAEVTSVPFMYHNKPAAQIVLVDISERKRAEDERRKLESQIQHTQKLESLGVLAGGIAHDFNNLLVGILGNAGLALMELPTDSPTRKSIESIETAAIRASELTKQMLAYSGKGKFLINQLNLSKVVEEISHLLEVSISKRVVLSYHFADNLPNIEGDVTQIRQVVMNLITNASEAIGDRNGMVSITTGSFYADRGYFENSYVSENMTEGHYIFIEVKDTGSGMDEETLKRIFDPFFTTKFTGRGLGLAAVIGIVRGHHGTIKVTSELGVGTTFRVLFPVSNEELKSESTQSSTNHPEWKSTGSVLVVDDEPSVLVLAKQLFEMKGFTVITASDGLEAISQFRQFIDQIQFVLLDLTLPKMSGEEVFREIRQLKPDARIILSSGYNEQEVTSLFEGKGIAGFIQKPYRIQELLDKIREILEQ